MSLFYFFNLSLVYQLRFNFLIEILIDNWTSFVNQNFNYQFKFHFYESMMWYSRDRKGITLNISFKSGLNIKE